MEERKSARWNIIKELFISFFRVGMFTFGGGYAMLPLIEQEVIDKRGWTNKEEIIDIYALGQSVPGVIAINTSIFLGHRLAGVLGAIAAAAGVIAPSIFVIVTIALLFNQIQSNVFILRAFEGIRAAVVGLVAAAAWRIARTACKDKVGILLAVIAFVVSYFTSIHAAWIIVSGGIVGLVWYGGLVKHVMHRDGKKVELND